MQLFANNLTVSLSNPAAPGDLSMILQAGEGSLFPAISSPDYLLLTLAVGYGVLETDWEIVKVTAVVGDIITVERDQESTGAKAWIASDVLEHRLTAGSMSNLIQAADNGGAVISDVVIKDYAETIPSVGSVATVTTVDYEAGNAANISVTENTTIAIDNPPPAGVVGTMSLFFTQDGTGGWTVAFPASVTRGTLDLNTDPNKETHALLTTRDGGVSYTLYTSFKDT